MKKKNFHIPVLISIVLVLFGCKNEEVILQVPEVTTFSVTDIAYQSVTCGGSVSSEGAAVTSRGICWSTKPTPTIADSIIAAGNESGSFTITVHNLKPDSTYYIRAYATNNAGTGYGSIMQFKTKHASINVITAPLSDISYQSANCGGSVTCEGTSITACGICWSLTSIPTLEDSTTIDGVNAGSFYSTMKSLKPDLTYYVRAYATNGIDTIFGSIMKFKTKRASFSVSTTQANMILHSTAISGGTITAPTGVNILASGVCWSLLPYPTVEDYNTKVTSTTNSFNATLFNLQPNTLYYARAYASTYNELIYGDNIIFKTRETVLSVTAPSLTNITATTIDYSGIVTSEQPVLITARGVCWSTNNNPTITDNKTTDGIGDGSFTSTITGLKANTTYYIRTYVTDNQGIVYGDIIAFKTADGPVEGAPVVSTISVTRMDTYLKIQGQILNEGYSPVTKYGYCYSTYQNPTISTSPVSGYDWGNPTTFSFNTTTLFTTGKKYFIRVYAVNSYGVGYGNVIEYVH